LVKCKNAAENNVVSTADINPSVAVVFAKMADRWHLIDTAFTYPRPVPGQLASCCGKSGDFWSRSVRPSPTYRRG